MNICLRRHLNANFGTLNEAPSGINTCLVLHVTLQIAIAASSVPFRGAVSNMIR